METPAEMQQRLWRDPLGFANTMEKHGRQKLKNPETAFAGDLLIGGAADLREHLKKQMDANR